MKRTDQTDQPVGQQREPKWEICGYGVGISTNPRARRPPALNTKKSHFSATNFKTCYMLIFNYLLVSITL